MFTVNVAEQETTHRSNNTEVKLNRALFWREGPIAQYRGHPIYCYSRLKKPIVSALRKNETAIILLVIILLEANAHRFVKMSF